MTPGFPFQPSGRTAVPFAEVGKTGGKVLSTHRMGLEGLLEPWNYGKLSKPFINEISKTKCCWKS